MRNLRTHNWRWQAAACLVGLSCSWARPSTAFLGGESLVSIFNGEGNIAVADLSNPREQRFDHEGSSVSCGWAYTAEVIESISGDGKTFEFVLTSAEVAKKPLPPGRYLVFTKRDPALPATARISPQEECWSRIDYYTSLDIEMVFPVVPGTSEGRAHHRRPHSAHHRKPHSAKNRTWTMRGG